MFWFTYENTCEILPPSHGILQINYPGIGPFFEFFELPIILFLVFDWKMERDRVRGNHFLDFDAGT